MSIWSFACLCCFVTSNVFQYMAGMPYEHSEHFKPFWLTKIRKREERKVLLSLKSCGIQLGPYGIASKRLGALICYAIMNNAVDAVLLFSE